MKIKIDGLDGNIYEFELADADSTYPSDNVIYFDSIPCALDTARAVEEVEVDERGCEINQLRAEVDRLTAALHKVKNATHFAQAISAAKEALKGAQK